MKSEPYILVVDDDPDILDSLVTVLESLPVRIKTARDGKEKLKIADGIMIGREALRNPLIFAQVQREMTQNCGPEKSTGDDFKNFMMRLLELIQRNYEPEYHLRRLKAYTRFLVSGRCYSKKLREKIIGFNFCTQVL